MYIMAVYVQIKSSRKKRFPFPLKVFQRNRNLQYSTYRNQVYHFILVA